MLLLFGFIECFSLMLCWIKKEVLFFTSFNDYLFITSSYIRQIILLFQIGNLK